MIGFSLKLSDAQVRAAEKILEQHKEGITAEQFLKKASRKGCPLRTLLDYGPGGDKRMAHVARLEVCRQIIMTVKIEPVVAKELNIGTQVRAALGTGAGWVSTENILKDPELRGRLLRKAVSELRGFLGRYEMLEELGPVMKAIATILRRHGEAA